jgi:hypothetical protein
MQSFPSSCHFLPLRCKYSPQHTVLKHPQSLSLQVFSPPFWRMTWWNWQLDWGGTCKWCLMMISVLKNRCLLSFRMRCGHLQTDRRAVLVLKLFWML